MESIKGSLVIDGKTVVNGDWCNAVVARQRIARLQAKIIEDSLLLEVNAGVIADLQTRNDELVKALEIRHEIHGDEVAEKLIENHRSK